MDAGVSWVVVVHLSPDHDSHLAELLQPHASIPVSQVSETVLLEPDHVYVIPPDANLSAVDTHLRLEPMSRAPGARRPIDHFLRTLAATHDGHSVGAVLSGTGSDGTRGLLEIRRHGGLTIVQDPEEAEYDAMPRSALAAGIVDLVLPVADMPDAAIEYARTTPRIPVSDERGLDDEEFSRMLNRIFTRVRERTGRDFSRYKRSTVVRRIARRMQIARVEQLDRYVEILLTDEGEVRNLADDLSIVVTDFFRDPQVFDTLERTVIPGLFDGKGDDDEIRVWSVGCATGEEPYSLAMLLIEEARRRDVRPRLLVFATDVHDGSLERARTGLYPHAIDQTMSERRLHAFFDTRAGGYQVRKELRDLIVFARHDLLADAPFSRIDLIACRNLLIYLQRSVQPDVLALFHYALRQDGMIVVGNSESVDSGELFRIEHEKAGIYRKRNVTGPATRLPVFPGTSAEYADLRRDSGRKPADAGYGRLHQQVVERLAPPSLLVNAEHNIVHLSENASRYLTHPGGELTANVFRVVRKELRLPLRTALHELEQGGGPQSVGPVDVALGSDASSVRIDVRRSLDLSDEPYTLVTFYEFDARESGSDPLPRTGPAGGVATEGTSGHGLEDELALAQQRLEAIIDQYEASQEDLRSSNEELQSSNEELRSTLEELETSKEELQSMNEELQTVNQENRNKVDELAEITADLQNLLSSTDIATLFLDSHHRILRFTPQVAQVFNVRDTDQGRPVTDLTHGFGAHDFSSDAQEALETFRPVEREVRHEEGRWFLARILPYRTADERVDGTVMTFVDITALKEAESALRDREARFRALATAASPVLYRMSPDWSELWGLEGGDFLADATEPTSAWLDRYIQPEDQQQVLDAIGNAIRNQAVFELEHRVIKADGRVGWTLSRAVPILDDEEIIEWFGAATDVTERHSAEDERDRERQLLDVILEALPVGIVVSDPDGVIIRLNPAARELWGTTPQDDAPIDFSHRIGWWPDTDERIGPDQWAMMRTLNHGEEVRNELVSTNGAEGDPPRYYLNNTTAVFDEQGRIFAGVGAMVDVTERREAEERLRRMINIEGVVVLIFDQTGTLIDANETFFDFLGYDREALASRELTWRSMTPEPYLEISERQMQKLDETGKIGPYEKEYLASDGSTRWMLVAGARLPHGDVVKYAVDVTDRYEAVDALKASEERFRRMANLVPDLLWQSDPDGSVTWVNERWTEFTGQTIREAMGWGWTGVLHPQEKGELRDWYSTSVEVGEALHREQRVLSRRGHWRWHLIRAEPVRDREGGIQAWFGAGTDIHEQKTLTEDLESRVRSVQRSRDELTRRLVSAEEEERRRLSGELHDQMGQLVTGLSLGLKALEDRDDTDDIRPDLRTLRDLADQIGAEAHEIALVLRPPALDRLGLNLGLRSQLEEWSERHGIEWDFQAVGVDGTRFPHLVETTLHRVTQEALTNVAKHAAAERVSLLIEYRDGVLRAVVEDDGHGFDVVSAVEGRKSVHLGLAGMQERLRLLDGSFEIDSIPGNGTAIIVSIPTEPIPEGS